MGEKNDYTLKGIPDLNPLDVRIRYDILLEQYLKERRMYQAQDCKQALKESLTDMKIRLNAYNNGDIPDFEKKDGE